MLNIQETNALRFENFERITLDKWKKFIFKTCEVKKHFETTDQPQP
jgi:hypothetical protein